MIQRALRTYAVTFVALLLAFGCAGSATTAMETGTPLDERVESLSRSYKFSEVLEILAGYSWAQEKSPALLTHYLLALFEARQNLPESVREPVVPKHVAAFAAGFWAGLNGEWDEAEKIHSEITRLPGHEAWGYAGLVGLALLADNPVRLGPYLDSLERLVGSKSKAWDVPFHRATYRIMQGEYKGLEEFLREHRSELHPAELAHFQARLFVRQNQFDEARAVLAGLPKEYNDDLWTIVSMVEIIEMEQGTDRYIDYMEKQLKRFPHARPLQIDYAYRLVDTETPAKVEEGLAILRLVSQRPIDILTRLRIANAYLDQGKTQEYFKIMYTITRSSYGWVPLLHATVARMSWMTTGAFDIADAEINRARQMAPKNEEVLWMLYRLHKSNKNEYDAIRVLRDILEVEPRDVPAQLALAEMLYRVEKLEAAALAAESVLKEKRYVSGNERDRMLLVILRVNCAQGKSDLAREALEKIASKGARSEAEVVFKKLCDGRKAK